MRKYLSLILIASLAPFSCEEEQVGSSELAGSWNWVATCGGITGGCHYPNQDDHMEVHFIQSRFIKTDNGLTTQNAGYNVASKQPHEFYTTFELQLDDGYKLRMLLSADTLQIEMGDLFQVFKKATK